MAARRPSFNYPLSGRASARMLHIAHAGRPAFGDQLSPPLGLVAAAFAALHALLHKRRPQSAFGWIAVCLTLPFVRRTALLLVRHQPRANASPQAADASSRVPTAPPSTSARRRRSSRRSRGSAPPSAAGRSRPATASSCCTDAAAIFDGDDRARSTAPAEYVYFSTYIFDAGPLGQRFLGGAHGRGASAAPTSACCSTASASGTRGDARATLLRGTRVRFARFLPPRLWPPTVQRELAQPPQDPRRRRRRQPSRAASTFATDISTATADERIVDSALSLERARSSRRSRPCSRATGSSRQAMPMPRRAARAANRRGSGAMPRRRRRSRRELDRLTALLTGAIGSARQRVAIMTPYFLPPRELIAPLQAAALAGVDVAVILPARNNLPYVHRATRHMLWELLERGVQVYYQPRAVRAQQAVLRRRLLRADRLGELRPAQLALELRDERRGVRPRHGDGASAALRGGSSSVRRRDVGGRRWPLGSSPKRSTASLGCSRPTCKRSMAGSLARTAAGTST